MRVLVLVFSVVMLLAVVAVVASSCDADTHDVRLVLLVLSLVTGLARLLSATGGSSTIVPGTGSPPDSVRRGPPDERPQLAGSTCAHCEQKIMLETEGALCKTCEKPLHRECRKPHKTDAHRPVSGQAYR